jgi:hypothetical protein
MKRLSRDSRSTTKTAAETKTLLVTGNLFVFQGCLNYYETEQTEVIVRFEVFTAVTMKNGVFWDVTA